MKRFIPVLVVFSLLAAADPVAAQTQTPQPPATPATQPPATPSAEPAERKPLILQLDEASRRQILYGPGSQSTGQSTGRTGADGLPSLGGDARSLGTMRADPFPKTSDQIP